MSPGKYSLDRISSAICLCTCIILFVIPEYIGLNWSPILKDLMTLNCSLIHINNMCIYISIHKYKHTYTHAILSCYINAQKKKKTYYSFSTIQFNNSMVNSTVLSQTKALLSHTSLRPFQLQNELPVLDEPN